MKSSGLTRALALAWRWLRSATGDDAYDRYVEHHGACHAGDRLLTRAEYYDESQRRKWSGVSRCC
ncbi:MAG TPA: YbdD/YjiX family protein [Steroidobacteraceae bacterium]|nr:YbdD/YjiX family protein [Steroidobacteraceae bacterium]